jgi:hypothetical protein
MGIMDMGKVLISLLCLLSAFLCNPQQRPKELLLKEESGLSEAQAIPLNNTIGVVTLNKQAFNSDKSRGIQIFNKDGTLWYEIHFYSRGGGGKLASQSVDFRPLSLHLDYFVLALKCVGKEGSLLKVVVNEITGLTKFVNSKDELLKIETWENHILHLFAVSFNPLKNPLLDRPSGNAKPIRIPKDVFFHPSRIKGDWLMVRWDVIDKSGKIKYGWVKWRESNKLIVNFYYFA